MYAVKTGQFEGPLDLLLDLIESRKLSINDVSLAQITDQYFGYIKQLERFPLAEVALFVAIASTLMLIKSRSLMPSMELTEEEEASIEELEGRLKIYRRVKELSAHIQQMFGKNPVFAREGFKGTEFGFIEPKGLDARILRDSLQKILESLPEKICLPEAEVKKIITLEEKLKELVGRIEQNLRFSFTEFSTSRKDIGDKKIEIIVSFLAILELIKQGIVTVNQSKLFEEISICPSNNYGKY